MIKEIPKNLNVRQPYSDVYGDLDYIVGNVVEFLGVSKEEMGEFQWAHVQTLLKKLDWCMLRVNAILDPNALTEDDWNKALGSAPKVDA